VKPSILIVDDDPGTRFGYSRYLGKEGYRVEEAPSLSDARDAITSRRFGAVILDQFLPDGNGIDWIKSLRESHPDIAIIIVTGAGDIPLAVEAMRRGADNFLTKPVDMADLSLFLGKCLELGALRRKDLAQKRLLKSRPVHFGDSYSMKKVLELAAAASESDAPVCLLGETGTGKGVLARWIHERSQHRSAPFVEINCSSLRGDLLSSELFGHAKGAFTSALQDRQGLIEVADGGTLFLDEIGDMDLAVQSQLLKVIEDKCYRRLGEVKVRRSDFRLMCATNKDLIEETRQGRFRQDLYFRIHVFPIFLPPLRERTEDIPGLVRHILLDLHLCNPEVSPDVTELLGAYSWPGNIRELRNVLERSLLLARKDPLGTKHFPGLNSYKETVSHRQGRDLNRLALDYIEDAIKRSAGDVEKAAAELGISRATLYRKLKKLRAPQ
jgi:DNA-binding NtrC family response regulator